MKFFIVFIFIFQSVSLFADTSGGWSKESIVKMNWNFIKSQREEMNWRAKAVFEEIGKEAKLKFNYDKDMTAAEQKIQSKFLASKLSMISTEGHLRNLLTNLERNRKVLAKLEEEAERSWDAKEKAKPKTEQPQKETEMDLYGTKIKAKNLGVVLDDSYSMASYLPKLRQEIQKSFKQAPFKEVYGSFIQEHQELGNKVSLLWYYTDPIEGQNPFRKKWFCQSIPTSKAHYTIVTWERSVVTAMEALAYEHKVDAIYWFTDLKDKASRSSHDAGIKRLEKMLADTGVKIYLQTVDRRPTGKVKSLIKKSGGSYSKKK